MSNLWEKEEFFMNWEAACEEVIRDSYGRCFVDSHYETICHLRDELSMMCDMARNNEVGETDWDVQLGLMYSFVQVLQYLMDCYEE